MIVFIHINIQWTLIILIIYYETINGVRYTESDIDAILDAFIDDVKEFIYDLCDTYEKWGYSYFYDITEDVIETLESEYEFYESGKLYA